FLILRPAPSRLLMRPRQVGVRVAHGSTLLSTGNCLVPHTSTAESGFCDRRAQKTSGRGWAGIPGYNDAGATTAPQRGRRQGFRGAVVADPTRTTGGEVDFRPAARLSRRPFLGVGALPVEGGQ